LAGHTFFERPELKAPFSLSNLDEVIAFKAVGFVGLGHDPTRRPVRSSCGGPTCLLPALPEAQRQALALLVHNSPEIAKKAACFEGLGLSSSVVFP
jgi:hypothetical protein